MMNTIGINVFYGKAKGEEKGGCGFFPQGIGCYMFRIDADDVVGATMSGNEARFINHSCEVSTSISLLASKNLQKKIMIFALRRSATHQLYYILQTRLDWHMCI